MNLNNRAFTLIELLAMLVVLGILMAVTVPNITGILSESKNNILIEDVDKLVDAAKTKISTRSDISHPANNKCLVMTLDFLNDSDDFKKGPNDGEYDKFDSFVIVKREGTSYKYYVRLVEKNEDGKYGLEAVDYDAFKKKPKNYMKEITDESKLKDFKTVTEVATDPVVKKYCTESNAIQGFYKEA